MFFKSKVLYSLKCILDPFELNLCICCEIESQIHCFASGYSVISVLFVEKTFSFELSSKISVVHNVWVSLWISSFVPLVNMSDRMLVPNCL